MSDSENPVQNHSNSADQATEQLDFANSGSTTPAPQQETGAVKAEAGSEVPAEDHLTLKVTDNRTDVLFRVKPSTSMSRLINGFCKRAGKDRNSLRFLFDGERVSDEDTPKGLGMVDGDVIEVLSQQVGGSN